MRPFVKSPRRLAMRGGGYGADAVLDRLLVSQRNGMACDFVTGEMVVRDGTTLANNYRGDFRNKFTVTGTLAPTHQGIFIDSSNYATLALTAFPDISAAVTMFAEYTILSVNVANGYIALSIDNGATSNRHVLYGSTVTNGRGSYIMTTASSNVINIGPPAFAYTAGVKTRILGAATATPAATGNMGYGGRYGTEDTAFTMPAGLTTLRLGHRFNAADYLTGYLSAIAIVPARESNAVMAALSQ